MPDGEAAAVRGAHEIDRGRFTEIVLPTPAIGAKCYLIERKGIYLLERGPCVLRGIACTHAGTGALIARDGLPDENGFFPEIDTGALPNSPEAATLNGRAIYRATHAVMGMWQLDAGCYHGLMLFAQGGHESVSTIASVVWMPYRRREQPIAPAAEIERAMRRARK